MERTIRIRSGEDFRTAVVLGKGWHEDGLPFDRLVLEAGSHADVTLVILPGTDCTAALKVDLEGEDSHAEIYGMYICRHDEKVRISIDVAHKVPRCTSRQLFKGIAAGRSKVDFFGKITVSPDAQKTEAYQENHNLLLSDFAKVDTKPQLEIYADDVKCSHGATIGKLNEDEQFYMRSRGITLEQARVLQMISFLSPVADRVDDEHLRAEITDCLTFSGDES